MHENIIERSDDWARVYLCRSLGNDSQMADRKSMAHYDILVVVATRDYSPVNISGRMKSQIPHDYHFCKASHVENPYDYHIESVIPPRQVVL